LRRFSYVERDDQLRIIMCNMYSIKEQAASLPSCLASAVQVYNGVNDSEGKAKDQSKEENETAAPATELAATPTAATAAPATASASASVSTAATSPSSSLAPSPSPSSPSLAAAHTRPHTVAAPEGETPAADADALTSTSTPPTQAPGQPMSPKGSRKGRKLHKTSSGGLRIFKSGKRSASTSSIEEEGDESAPLASFACKYIGSVPVDKANGAEVVQVGLPRLTLRFNSLSHLSAETLEAQLSRSFGTVAEHQSLLSSVPPLLTQFLLSTHTPTLTHHHAHPITQSNTPHT